MYALYGAPDRAESTDVAGSESGPNEQGDTALVPAEENATAPLAAVVIPLVEAEVEGPDLKEVKALVHSHGQMVTLRTSTPQKNGFCASLACSLNCGAVITITKATKVPKGTTDEVISYVAKGYWHREGCPKCTYQHALDRSGVIAETMKSNPRYGGGSVFATLLQEKKLPQMDVNAPATGLRKTQVVKLVQRLKSKTKPKKDKDLTMADVLEGATPPGDVVRIAAANDPATNNWVVGFSTRQLLSVQALRADAAYACDVTFNLFQHGGFLLMVWGFLVFQSFYATAVGVTNVESEFTYAAFLGGIMSAMADISPGWSPRFVIRDLHDALHAGILRVFPDALQIACWFHITQCIRRRRSGDKKIQFVEDNFERILDVMRTS